jgi:nucleoside phosphorylase
MDWELAHLKGALPTPAAEWHHGHLAYLSRIGQRPVVLAACGMGMVSAAAGAQALISQYAPRAIFNYGCVGAHRPELQLGDLVVAERLVAADCLNEQPDGQLRYRGMTYLEAGEMRRTDALAADPDLLALARRAAEELAEQHEPWPPQLGWPLEVPHRSPRVAFGTLTSADRWNRSPASIAALVARHDSLCEDMEAAAIALVCASQSVPFLAVKDVSNNELRRPTQSGAAMLAELGADQIARRAAAFTLAILQAYVAEHG